MHRQYYEDFKYVMQDTYQVYLGTRYTLEEITENEEVPFKFRLIVERYIYEEVDPQTTLESQLYYMEAKGIPFKLYKRLKAKVKYNCVEEKKSFGGKVKKQYTTKTVPIENFAAMSVEEKESISTVVQELILSKMAIMSF